MYYSGPFDHHADVVVVGFGAAGAVTAITAHDEGAHVLIIEKQEAEARRPNSRFSGGLFICPSDVDAARHYMTQLYRINDDLYETDQAVIDIWAEETARNYDWLVAAGGVAVKVSDHGEHDAIEGHDSISLYKPDMNDHPGSDHRGWGYGLFTFLSEKVAERSIEVSYGTSAQWLLTNAEGAVIGVQVERHGVVTRIRAGRGVVMTCGGFEFNDWMKLNSLRVFPTYFYGNPENTGDGIRMAQEIGAELWHMNSCAARLVARFPHPAYPGGTPVDFWGVEALGVFVAGFEQFVKGELQGDEAQRAYSAPALPAAQMQVAAPAKLAGCVVTDRFGLRFTNEVYRAHVLYYELTNLDSHRMVLPKVPSWWIFDQRRMDLGRLTPTMYGPTGPLQQVPWSTDNRAEVERGWILKANSIPELAAKCSMDPGVLASTVATYNSYCAAGEDPDFGRPVGTLVPLAEPPYYAVQLWPGGPNTQGGPRRDADARIVSVRGEPIPHLYSAGEFGSVYGMLYPSGGGNIAECLAFGRIAGRNAAAESPN
jgi:hypothetical protein